MQIKIRIQTVGFWGLGFFSRFLGRKPFTLHGLYTRPFEFKMAFYVIGFRRWHRPEGGVVLKK